MTVETTNRKQTFSGGQSSLTFTFRTLVSNPEYVKVKLQNVSTNEETDLTYALDFTVAVNSDGVGGVVSMTPSYSTSYNYIVYRQTNALQSDDYDDFNQFPANTLENSLDRAIMILQEVQETTSRTLTYPIGGGTASAELPSPEANTFIGWNATATALENKEFPDPSTLQKATNTDAMVGTDDTKFMTAAKVKIEVENAGTVSIPPDNLQTVTVTKGGTGITVYTQGDIPYASSPSTLSRLAATNAGKALTTNGAGTNPTYEGMTTRGDIEYHNGTTRTRLPAGTAGQVLTTNGPGADPIWSSASTASSTRMQIFLTSGSFTAIVARNYLTMVGGGGAGGGTPGLNRGAGGGAGGQQIFNYPIILVPGNSYNVIIGAGGIGVSGSAGGTGGTTSFDTISVIGGLGGAIGTNAGTSAGGSGQSANGSNDSTTGGKKGFSSGSGGSSSSNTGGSGGGSNFGDGGGGGTSNSNGSSASANTGAGGGGGGGGTTTGGDGGSGVCIISW